MNPNGTPKNLKPFQPGNRANPGGRPDEITLELRRSDAWRAIDIHAHKVLDYLISAYQSGQANGAITARRIDLVHVIYGKRITDILNELERVGLVDVMREVGCVNLFTLTWIGVGVQPPSDRWRGFMRD